MSRYRFWEEGDRYPSKKAPAPEHGIKIGKAGSSWWGQRWLDALTVTLGADAGRLARGRTYARAGRTHDLEVKKGKVHALVTGSRATPYQISIALRALPADTWSRVITALASKAQFSAELLAGEMPKDLEEVFRSAGASLFPTERADLVTSCTCPDWGDPCKHVAATHYVLGDALDRDPFLLFELRGRKKEQVLEALRLERGAAPGVKSAPAKKKRGPKKSTIAAADYDKAPAALPSISFSFEAPASSGALLRQLGAPQGWAGTAAPADALGPLVQAAAARARQLALATDDDDSETKADDADIDPDR